MIASGHRVRIRTITFGPRDLGNLAATGMSAATATCTLRDPHPDLVDTVGWLDSRVCDALGRRVGRVTAVYVDRQGRPWWIAVGRRGRTYLAPVGAVRPGGHGLLWLACTREQLAAAGPAEMSPALHEALVTRYGLGRRARLTRRRDPCASARRRRHIRR